MSTADLCYFSHALTQCNPIPDRSGGLERETSERISCRGTEVRERKAKRVSSVEGQKLRKTNKLRSDLGCEESETV